MNLSTASCIIEIEKTVTVGEIRWETLTRMRLGAFHGSSQRKGGERTAGGTHGSGRESEREGDECRLFTLEGISSPCDRLDWDYVGRTAG